MQVRMIFSLWTSQWYNAVASPGFVTWRGKARDYVMGHSRLTSGPGAAAARWLIVLWLMQYWSKELWVVDICISSSHRTTQYLDSWLSALEVDDSRRGPGEHVPQCPIAGDATVAKNGKCETCTAVSVAIVSGQTATFEASICVDADGVRIAVALFTAHSSTSVSQRIATLVHGSHFILVLKFKDFFRTFQDLKFAFSRTNFRRKFTAWTVLKQHVISISVITGQFQLIKTKRDNY